MFQKTKEAYREQRESERKKLISYLQKQTLFANNGLEIVTGPGSGSGHADYTSNGRVAPVDLHNWKWVECKSPDEQFNLIISLNMPDSKAKSVVCLYDRVGLILSYNRSGEHFESMIWTDIDLPFDDKSLDKITQLIIEQFGIYKWLNAASLVQPARTTQNRML